MHRSRTLLLATFKSFNTSALDEGRIKMNDVLEVGRMGRPIPVTERGASSPCDPHARRPRRTSRRMVPSPIERLPSAFVVKGARWVTGSGSVLKGLARSL